MIKGTMVKKLLLAIVGILFYTVNWAQIQEKELIGLWHLEGKEINGTLYQTNVWNEETYIFSEDYTFKHILHSYSEQTIHQQTLFGKWMLSKDSSTIVLFNAFTRFQKDVTLKTVYKELTPFMNNENYIAWEEKNKGLLSKIILKKEEATGTFQENLATYQAEQRRKNSVFDADYFHLVKDQDTIRKKYGRGTYTFSKTDNRYSDDFFEKRHSYDGSIQKITDSSIFIRPSYVFEYQRTKRNSKRRDLEVYTGKSLLEIPHSHISTIQTPWVSIAKKTSVGLSAASAFTTLIVAPIVGLVSSKNVKQHYINTAGAGLIGVGVGTGSYFIFNAIDKKFKSKGKKGIDFAPIYHQKK